MSRVRLLHWNANEARTYSELLRSGGYEVDYDPEFRPSLMRAWRESPPQAFVIDLSRLPSHGREIAIALRQSPATRRVPIVFCEGAHEKVSRIQKELPDAVFCSRATLRTRLRAAIATPSTNPVKPVQMMDRYRSRTAAQKLGIREASRVALIDPPSNYGKVLGELPEGVQFFEDTKRPSSVTLCFVRDPDSLQRRLSTGRSLASTSKLWIVWPKKAAKSGSSVSETVIRQHGIALGLVDYKICSVNEVWSAMLFAVKGKSLRARPTP